MLAIVVQGIAANITNVYTGGLSLVNTAPVARARAGDAARRRSPRSRCPAFPDFVDHAQRLDHAPRQRGRAADGRRARRLPRPPARARSTSRRCSIPNGRYRFLNGVNVEAVLAVAGGVAVYYALPDAWLKVVWGVGAGAAFYLAARRRPRGSPAPEASSRADERRPHPRALRRARAAQRGGRADHALVRLPSLVEAADVVAGWMEEAGLAVRRDAVGNVIGRRGGGEGTFVLGSHIDTVRDAGALRRPARRAARDRGGRGTSRRAAVRARGRRVRRRGGRPLPAHVPRQPRLGGAALARGRRR